MAAVPASKFSVAPGPHGRRRRRLRTPLVMQVEAADCGTAWLGIVLARFGCWVPLEGSCEECGAGRDGVTLEDIAVAARKYGLQATGRSSQIDGLAELPSPMILFWGFKHFVVLDGIGNGRYDLNDPAEEHRVVDQCVFNLLACFDLAPLERRPHIARHTRHGRPESINHLAGSRLGHPDSVSPSRTGPSDHGKLRTRASEESRESPKRQSTDRRTLFR